MYDTVSKTLFTNAGAGAFEKGAAVGGDTPKYTNQIPTSLDTDEKTVYNGTGYALNTRLGSDGTTRTGATNCVTSGLYRITEKRSN